MYLGSLLAFFLNRRVLLNFFKDLKDVEDQQSAINEVTQEQRIQISLHTITAHTQVHYPSTLAYYEFEEPVAHWVRSNPHCHDPRRCEAKHRIRLCL